MPLNKEVAAKLLEQVNKSKAYCEFNTTDNQKRFTDSYLYYEGKLPEPYDMGLAPKDATRSSRIGYVENVTKEAERKLTPAILAVFTENDSEAVRFAGKGFKRDPFIDQMINTEINNIFLRRNDGYMHLENSIKEALVTGNGFMKVFVEEEIIKDKLPLKDWMPLIDLISQLSQNPDAEGSQWHLDIDLQKLMAEKKGKIKGLQWRTVKEVLAQNESGEGIEAPSVEVIGSAPLTMTKKKIKVEQAYFKDLIFDTSCGSDFDKCRYICHKNIITVGEAIKMGFDPEALKSASTDNGLTEAALSTRNLLTTSQFNADMGQLDYSSDELERKITLYEHYTYSSIPDGKTKLYQIIATQTEILDDPREIPDLPFVNMRTDIVPGSFWGHSLYDTCKHYQDILSTFARVTSQKAISAAFPKFVAVKGQYDRESLLNANRPGAVIEVNAPEAIEIITEPQPPQEMFSMMQYFTNSLDKKTSTSVGALADSNGDMPENVSGQSISMMIANEGLKDKVMAKAVARTGIRPLFEKLYKVMRDAGIMIQTTQGTITSDQFPELYDFEIDINTANDKMMQNRSLANTLQVLAQISPQGIEVISPTNKVAIASQLLEGSELDASQFFSDPSANVSPEEIEQQKRDAQEDKILEKNVKLLGYQTASAEFLKTLAEIYKIEVSVDEHVKDGHMKRETSANESLHKMQMTQIHGSTASAEAMYKQAKIDLENKFANQETILKVAELHQKGSTNTDINGVNVR